MTAYKDGIAYNRLEDLIAGVTPTFVDWTVDPTDAADITDGDISTFCTTGNKNVGAGGWAWAFFDWDFGGMYDVLLTGVGTVVASDGVPQMFPSLFDGTDYIDCVDGICTDTVRQLRPYSGRGSKLRLGITSTDASTTTTPNIREFHAWRL